MRWWIPFLMWCIALWHDGPAWYSILGLLVSAYMLVMHYAGGEEVEE